MKKQVIPRLYKKQPSKASMLKAAAVVLRCKSSELVLLEGGTRPVNEFYTIDYIMVEKTIGGQQYQIRIDGWAYGTEEYVK